MNSQIHLEECTGAHGRVSSERSEVEVGVRDGVGESAVLERDVDVGRTWVLPVSAVSRGSVHLHGALDLLVDGSHVGCRRADQRRSGVDSALPVGLELEAIRIRQRATLTTPLMTLPLTVVASVGIRQ